MNVSPVLLSLIVAAGAIVGALIGFLKLKPERESIIVTAATGAVVIQEKVLDDLHQGFERLRRDVDGLRRELKIVKDERDRYRTERDEARKRVTELEQRVAELEQAVHRIEQDNEGRDG